MLFLPHILQVSTPRLRKSRWCWSTIPFPVSQQQVHLSQAVLYPVLATCDIRSQMRPLRTPYHVSRSLPIPQRKSRIEMHVPTHLHKGRMYTVQRILTFIKRLTHLCFQSLHHRFVAWTKPSNTSLLLGTLTDLARSKSELVAENALLRQPLSSSVDRSNDLPAQGRIVCSSCFWPSWFEHGSIRFSLSSQRRSCAGIVRAFKLFWKYKSRAASSKPKIPAETVALIKEMATHNRLWGAERIRGELLKLGIRVCKRTIQKYMRPARSPRRARTDMGYLPAEPCQRPVGV